MSALRAGWRRFGRRVLWLALVGLAIAALGIAYLSRDHWRTPATLYRLALDAPPERAAVLYQQLGDERPEIAEYAQLWAAEALLPAPEAVASLHELSRYRPDSPSALWAHVTLARYYASIESPDTVTSYRAALEIDDRAEIRVELARYLEAQNALAAAYREYRALLGGDWPDAFADMRRTASDPLALAEDLLARHYCSDVVDALRREESCEAHRLRASALACLGRSEDADIERAAYAECSAPPPTLQPATTPDEALAAETPSPIEGESSATQVAPPPPPTPELPSNPIELWTAAGEWENAGTIAGAIDAYLQVAQSTSHVADDAAYRAWVLARRLDDAEREADALESLRRQGPTWLGYRATGELSLDVAPSYPVEALDELSAPVLAKVRALESLGRTDLAHGELRLTALNSETPEIILGMAQGLSARGHVREAYSLGRAYLEGPGGQLKRGISVEFWRMAYPRAHESAVQRSAEKEGVDPHLLWAVMRRESAFDPLARSGAGARGLMQIMPATQREIAEWLDLGYDPFDALRPEPAVDLGAAYLREMLRLRGGDMELALMSYNAGPGAVASWVEDPALADRDDLLRFLPYGETREYVERVGLDYLIYQQVWAE